MIARRSLCGNVLKKPVGGPVQGPSYPKNPEDKRNCHKVAREEVVVVVFVGHVPADGLEPPTHAV
jgi:hypothetical protein